MMAMLWCCLVLVIFSVKIDDCKGAFTRERLSVTFGKWEQLPLNSSEAANQGWKIDASCKGSKRNFFKGYRYLKDNDEITRLLFDCHGRVAGIQATISPPSSYPTKFNSAFWHRNPDGTISATAYFRHPKHICSCKKYCNHHSTQKLVGDRLWIQLHDGKKDNFMKIPLRTKNLVNTAWVEGNCFPAMGVHYHYNISRSFDCNYAVPVFLIASKQTGHVHGFGWGVPFLVNSKRWEHPSPSMFARSIKEENIPACIRNYKNIAVQHVYFVNARKISCSTLYSDDFYLASKSG